MILTFVKMCVYVRVAYYVLNRFISVLTDGKEHPAFAVVEALPNIL